MLTRRRFVTALTLLLPGSIVTAGSHSQSPSAKPTTVTLIIDGMT